MVSNSASTLPFMSYGSCVTLHVLTISGSNGGGRRTVCWWPSSTRGEPPFHIR